MNYLPLPEHPVIIAPNLLLSQCDRQLVTMPVYHWTEVNSLCSRLTPGMIEEAGIIKRVNCRLRGESPIGHNAVSPQIRLVKHDIDYCVYRLTTILKQLNLEQTKTIFERYLDERGTNK